MLPELQFDSLVTEHQAEPPGATITTPTELPPFGLKVEVDGQDPTVEYAVEARLAYSC